MSGQSGAEFPGASEAALFAGGGASGASIDLYWLPLGAGGHFVRLNGRIYEAIQAFHDHRRAFDLFHSALQARVPEGRYVVEMAWSIPDADGESRGVVVEGPVGNRRMARFRLFRYEVRRWRDGVIPDVLEATGNRFEDPEDIRQALLRGATAPGSRFGRPSSQAKGRTSRRPGKLASSSRRTGRPHP